MYKLQNDFFTGNPSEVIKQVDNMTIIIPFDEANTDYQEYLAWVAEGNEPEEAE